jgi:hypothetical protein
MVKKRGQLKIQQMAFMLLAVTLFFAFVGMFVLVIKMAGLRETAEELQERNAMLLVTRLANSPEFSCGESFGSGRVNCIDSDKVMMLRENIERYSGFWDVANVEIRKIGPIKNQRECDIKAYPNCEILKLREGNISAGFSNFVSLCRKDIYREQVYDKCELARLMVSYGN